MAEMVSLHSAHPPLPTQLLKGAVEAETLSYDDYLARVDAAIRADMALARALKDRGFEDAYATKKLRACKMKAELHAATSKRRRGGRGPYLHGHGGPHLLRSAQLGRGPQRCLWLVNTVQISSGRLPVPPPTDLVAKQAHAGASDWHPESIGAYHH